MPGGEQRDYEQTVVAELLKKLLALIKNDRAQSSSDRQDKYGSLEPELYSLATRHVGFPVRVTGVTSSNLTFQGRILDVNTLGVPPWKLHTDLATPLTVRVSTTNDLPQMGDEVVADYVGSYGNDFTPMYGFFGGAGGSCSCATTLTVITTFRVNVSSLTLEAKTRTVRLCSAWDESDWTLIHQGTACTTASS